MPIAPETRIIDEARLYKSILARAICNPFWDEAPQQDSNAQYSVGETDVSGSSVAEAAARSVCLLSFIRFGYEKHPVAVTKDEEPIEVGNIWKEKQLHSILFERGNYLLKSILPFVSVEASLISARRVFPLLTARIRPNLLIHSVNLRNWTGVPLLQIMGWIINRITRTRKASAIFQMTYGVKALRNSESLSGTGASAMWRMAFLCVEI